MNLNKTTFHFLWIFIILLTFNHQLIGQQFQNYVNKPSPNSMSIVNNIITPVDYYRGIPNIGIPLYSVKEGDISVPISISYNASGHKVNDIASFVGLGWSLQTGGSITRVVHGKPDEDVEGYCGQNQRGLTLSQYYDTQQSLENFNNNTWDGEPDIFYYNFNGVSGRFILNYHGDPVLIPHNDIEIKPAIGRKATTDGTWQVTLPNGTKLILGASNMREESSITFAEQTETFYSTWYLNSIETISGHKINFDYQNLGQIKFKDYMQQRIDRPVAINPNYGFYDGYKETVISSFLIIKEINSNNHKIVFDLQDSDRYDLEGGKALKQIRVLDKDDNLRNIFHFKTSYFASHRLRLDEIQQDNLPSYKFVYNINENLPSRDDFTQVDHWGYYNGNLAQLDENGNLVTSGGIPTAVPSNSNHLGASREANEDKAKANILTKIIYPTGGSTSYEYELNEYYNIDDGINQKLGGLRIAKQIIDNDYGNTREILYDYNDPQNPSRSSGQINEFIQPIPYYEDVYVLGLIFGGAGGTVQYDVTYSFPINELSGFENSPVVYKNVSVREIGNGKTIYTYSTYEDYPDLPPHKFDNNYNPISTSSSPYCAPTSYFWMRGLPKKKQIYDENNKLLQEEMREYSLNISTHSMKVLKSRATLDYTNFSYDWPTPTNQGLYYIHAGYPLEISRITKIYDMQNPSLYSSSTITYEYSNQHQNPIKISTIDSRGRKSITHIKYAEDFYDPTGLSFPAKMKVANQVNLPINMVTEREDVNGDYVFLSGTINLFDSHILDGSERVLPSQTISANIKPNTPINKFPSVIMGNFVYDANTYPIIANELEYKIDVNNKFIIPQQERINQAVYNSLIWGYENSLVIAKVENAKIGDVSHLNFEDLVNLLPNQWLPIDFLPSSIPSASTYITEDKAYTGKRSFKVVPNGKLVMQTGVENPNQAYILSCWVFGQTGDIFSFNNQDKTLGKNGWNYLAFKVDNLGLSSPTVHNKSSNDIYLDDLRLHPAMTRMTTYTYDPTVGITSESDDNSFAIYYFYDSLGRLSYTKDFDGNIIKTYKYHYKYQGE